ncbi:MAG: hypothetical protein KAI99_02985, partial [Cyclobacteriaceae bacterium]|nr:hypothetical protein [Cyclobacteriaceae bacterium]
IGITPIITYILCSNLRKYIYMRFRLNLAPLSTKVIICPQGARLALPRRQAGGEAGKIVNFSG